jgi:hypothetical protein
MVGDMEKEMTSIEEILRDTDGPITDEDRIVAADEICQGKEKAEQLCVEIAAQERVIELQRQVISELRSELRNKGD